MALLEALIVRIDTVQEDLVVMAMMVIIRIHKEGLIKTLKILVPSLDLVLLVLADTTEAETLVQLI